MSDPFLDSTRDLAGWLQEAGRRKPKAKRKPEAPPSASQRPSTQGFWLTREVQRTRWVPLFAIAALAYLQYFFADTFVQINSLPSVIVFVF
jgi:hypothetical protein